MARHKEMSIYNKIKYTISWNFDGHKKGTVQKKKAIRKRKNKAGYTAEQSRAVGQGH